MYCKPTIVGRETQRPFLAVAPSPIYIFVQASVFWSISSTASAFSPSNLNFRKRISICLIIAFILTNFLVEMSDSKNNEREVTAFKLNEPGWVNIDLGPRAVEPHGAKATVLPGWADLDLDLEARAPPKKPFWRFGKKSKILVGIAISAMLSAGIFVPMVVVILNGGGKRIR